MEKDIEKTDVVFRVLKINGITELTALLPHEIGTIEGHINCYAHCGQHGVADYNFCVKNSKLATETEYADLKKEMENLFGYNFNVIKKQNRRKYLNNYYKLRNRN
jgi:plasmid replication initiation protein